MKEGQDLNEVEEKCQCQKDHDVNGEKSVSCSIQITDVKRPFSSSQCGNTYKHKRSLKNHMRIHAGIKPFCCSQCGKSFTKKSYLKPVNPHQDVDALRALCLHMSLFSNR